MDRVSIPPRLQKRITEKLAEIPPESWRMAAWTEDQKRTWQVVRDLHVALAELFDDYFAGRGSRHHEWLGKVDIDFLGAYRNYFLAFYSAIQWGWQDIQPHLQGSGVSNPADALLLAMENAAVACLQNSFMPFRRWTTKDERNLIEAERKLATAAGKVKALVEKKHQRLEERCLGPVRGYFKFEEDCVSLCQKIARKDKTMKKLMRSLQIAGGDLERERVKGMHPRQRLKSYEWKDGTINTAI